MAEHPSGPEQRKSSSPFWVMNHLANPLVRLILSSPFHGLLSQSLVLLSYRGRKSGKRYNLPVDYAQSGDTVWILPGSPQQKTWWRNLRGGAPVEILFRGERRKGQATLLEGKRDAAAIAQGLALYFNRFPASSRLHAIHRSPEGTFDPAELNRAAQDLVLVRVQLQQRTGV